MKKVDKTSKKPILSLDEARRKIREILQGHGTVWPISHCKDRMDERRVQMDDISYCLFWGNVDYGREPGDRENNVFRVSHTDIEDEPLTVVVQIDTRISQLICLTVF